MIINNLNILAIAFVPPEYNAILIVDPDAMVSLPVSLQRLKPVGRGRQQISQGVSGIEHIQFPLRHFPQCLGKAS